MVRASGNGFSPHMMLKTADGNDRCCGGTAQRITGCATAVTHGIGTAFAETNYENRLRRSSARLLWGLNGSVYSPSVPWLSP